MGLLGRLFGKKAKPSFWEMTAYGLKPREVPGIDRPMGGGEPFRISRVGMVNQESYGIDRAIRAYHDVPAEATVYQMRSFLVATCRGCGTRVLLPEHRPPPFFKCPACAPEDEKVLLQYLCHLTPAGGSFDRCPKCGRYSELRLGADDMHHFLECADCGARNTMTRSNGIEPVPLDGSVWLICCSWCGRMFEADAAGGEPFRCPSCGSLGARYRCD